MNFVVRKGSLVFSKNNNRMWFVYNENKEFFQELSSDSDERYGVAIGQIRKHHYSNNKDLYKIYYNGEKV